MSSCCNFEPTSTTTALAPLQMDRGLEYFMGALVKSIEGAHMDYLNWQARRNKPRSFKERMFKDSKRKDLLAGEALVLRALSRRASLWSAYWLGRGYLKSLFDGDGML